MLCTRLSISIGRTVVTICEGDISKSRTEAVINAANESSFTPMDGGVSGALRNACGGSVAIGLEKNMWDDEGEAMASSKRVPPCHAGSHATFGNLAAQGVQVIVHAVGPRWTDHDEADFATVCLLICDTCRRALMTAVKSGATTATIPAVSGGIFCHKHDAQLKEREQIAARHELIRAVASHCSSASPLKEIVLIDLPSSHPASRIDLLLHACQDLQAPLPLVDCGMGHGRRSLPASSASQTGSGDAEEAPDASLSHSDGSPSAGLSQAAGEITLRERASAASTVGRFSLEKLGYSWDQTSEHVHLYFGVLGGCSKDQVSCTFTEQSCALVATLGGKHFFFDIRRTHALIDATRSEVRFPRHKRHVVLRLVKGAPGTEWSTVR